jgi:hypothetical protein
MLAAGTFIVLWLSNIPYRHAYQPSHDDITALADGLLLLPNAHWEDWFTHGHSNFFDAYPEWSVGQTGFARPAFQFLIYLAHFLFDKDWPSYLAINYLGLAGIAAVAFTIVRTVLGVGIGRALVLAALVAVSPAVFEYSIWEVGYASESFIAILAGCAFLTCIMRRDGWCVAVLLIALFTKETALWTPFAAFATVLLRSREPFRARGLRATAMLLPLAVWLCFRFAFYGGLGGTYATSGYTIESFFPLMVWKIEHLQNLFVQQAVVTTDAGWGWTDRIIRFGTLLCVVSLLLLWIADGLRAGWIAIGRSIRQRRWPAAEPPRLVDVWAAMGIAFYFCLAVFDSRYAASAIVFAWPAIGSTSIRLGGPIARTGLAACLIFSLARTAYFVVEMNPPSDALVVGQFFRAAKEVNGVLTQIPPTTRQVYVVFANGLGIASPQYIEAFLGIHADLVRVIDTTWNSTCRGKRGTIAFDHARNGPEVVIHATVPECATLLFWNARLDQIKLSNRRLVRSESISYEFPDGLLADETTDPRSLVDLGHRVTLRIRPREPARFIIGDSDPDAGVTWFDEP